MAKAPQYLIGSHPSCKWEVIPQFLLCSPLSGLKDWPLTLRKLSLFRLPHQEQKSQERLTLFANSLGEFSSKTSEHLHNSAPPGPAARQSLTSLGLNSARGLSDCSPQSPGIFSPQQKCKHLWPILRSSAVFSFPYDSDSSLGFFPSSLISLQIPPMVLSESFWRHVE